ncbi:MAG TPA: Gldg family protein [Pirellulales bacterium]|nr:Gldg family protein [Pirellulales bacterium]
MNPNVIRAIFRRNFNSYFSNPTGYVFICVYVLLSSFAAFWPNEFFNDNLANLDQLNHYLPYILLVFIPAITMSVWAEERRQGTDELLLTIPAGDLDVVLGKYLSTVAIYSVALIFSAFCNLAILSWLGNPDKGLFFGTYFGYWLVGLAMLAIGMVASFLTGNLTVGFVLGAMFNAPLAFAENADVIMPGHLAMEVKSWSLEEQFRDFGRGVISLSGVIYFIALVVAMLYLCMVLIGRRHWQGGRDGQSMGGHYLIRALALIVAAVGITMTFHHFDTRVDVTSERLSSLSSQTKKLIRELDPKLPVKVDAYISPEVPESYVQTRLDLVSALREFGALGGNKVDVTIHPTEPLSEEADQAEQQFGITGQQVTSRSRGAISREQLFLGVAFTSGLKKVVVPFFDRGIPVEYELVRSICTVSQQDRKKVGVLATDAKLYGGMNFQTFSQTPNEVLISELEKQYEVVQVNADSPIEEELDVLLAAQPSSLTPEQMKNFVAAVKRGVPTAIFEDPFPAMRLDVPGTSQPKRPPQQNPFGGSPPPQPKGKISELWTLLGVDFMGSKVVWQRYNPIPKLQAVATPEWVFIDSAASDKPVFDADDPISSRLQLLLFLYPGSVTKLNASELKFEELVMTGDQTGTVDVNEIIQQSMFGQPGGLNPRRRFIPSRQYYTLAARISGALKKEEELMSDAAAEPAEDKAEEEKPANAEQDGAEAEDAEEQGAVEKNGEKKDAEEKAPPKEKDINVVLVCDIDMLFSEFFNLRAQGADPDRDFDLNFDNVTFVLNTLDELAGDERFLEIRKRRPRHRVLSRIETLTKEARQDAINKTQRFITEYDEATAKAQKEFQDKIDTIQKDNKSADPIELLQRVEMAREAGQRRLQAETDRLQKQRDRETTRIERELNLKISRVQDWYKMWAVLLPPIPPLLVGLGVYFNRRAREREGVSKARLR